MTSRAAEMQSIVDEASALGLDPEDMKRDIALMTEIYNETVEKALGVPHEELSKLFALMAVSWASLDPSGFKSFTLMATGRNRG